jgi:exodeoxyribonuclease III
VKIATWNVNGIRARHAQLDEWAAREQPDVICLQEIKASAAQLPGLLSDLEGYWCYWHGDKGYSGVALLVSQRVSALRPEFSHPPFDFERRIVTVRLGAVTVASVYVPNGGKDYPAKLAFLEALAAFADTFAAVNAPLVLCGDLNVALTDRDIHPKERKPNAIGTRADERALLARLIAAGLVDVGRAVDPDNDGLFTWWPPWRNMRARNIGWRIDYVLASAALHAQTRSCLVQSDVGTSDHAPVTAVFDAAFEQAS